jgi:hypothetical protein
MKIYGVKLVKEKELEILVDFFESVDKLGDWTEPWDVAVKSSRNKRWVYVIEKTYWDEEEDDLFPSGFNLPKWSP